MLNRYKILIAGILILAALLRLYQLSSVPPGPSLDEVSIGFNAKLIGETGRDEYGYRLPLLLRAYDDWRPGLYVYLAVPFVKLLGLNVNAVRLPAVILSLLSVLVVYLLTKKIFFGFPREKKELIALFSALLIAISPWHVYLSRLGHEVNLGLTVVLLFLYFFFKFLREERNRQINLVLSSVLWSFSFYTYQNQKIISPLLALFLLILYGKEILKEKKAATIAFLAGFVIFLPIFLVSLSPNALIRLKGTNVLTDTNALEQSIVRVAHDEERGLAFGKVFDNRRLALFNVVIRSYLSHFDPSWLFTNIGFESHKVPSLGLFYLWEIVLITGGAYLLLKEKGLYKEKILVFAWLLIGPLPGAIATQAPHAMRSFNVLPMPQLLSGFTLVFLFTSVKLKKVFYPISAFILLLSILFLFHNYFHNFPYEQSGSFQVSLQESLRYAIKNESNYQKIIVTNLRDGYQSYMFYLFLSDYDSQSYLTSGGTGSGGYNQPHKIGKFEFRPIDWGKEKQKTNTLMIGNFNDFPEELNTVKKFNLLNGQSSIGVISL